MICDSTLISSLSSTVGLTPSAVDTTNGRVSGGKYSGEEGFHFKETDQASKTVTPEGNTVVNVYWDRTEYTLTIQVQQGYGYTTVKTITALYGTSISDQFPIAGYTNYIWTSQNSSTFGDKSIVMADTMPAENVTFRGRNS